MLHLCATASFGGGPTLSLISSALHFVYSMLENVIRRVRRLLLSGYYVVSEDWPAGNFRRWHSGTTLRSRFHLSDGGLALAFIRPFQALYLFIYLFICLFICLFIYLFIRPFQALAAKPLTYELCQQEEVVPLSACYDRWFEEYARWYQHAREVQSLVVLLRSIAPHLFNIHISCIELQADCSHAFSAKHANLAYFLHFATGGLRNMHGGYQQAGMK